jgi:hypothetical protein
MATKYARRTHGRWSARTLFKAKDAAAQIKLIFVLGHAALEGRHNPAMNVFAVPDGLHNASFAQNAKVFGDIVLGNAQPVRQFAHRNGTGKRFLDDPPSRLVRQGLEKGRAAFRFGRCHTP